MLHWPPRAGLPGKLTLRGGAPSIQKWPLPFSPGHLVCHLCFLLSIVESAFCWQWAVGAGERILSKMMGDRSGRWATCILSEIGDEPLACPFPAFLDCTGWLLRSKLGTCSQPHSPFPSFSRPWTTLSSQPKPGWPSTFRLCAWGPPLPRGNSTLGSHIHSFIHFTARSQYQQGLGPHGRVVD